MLGARVTCLMFFARVFNWWVCGVAGEQQASNVCYIQCTNTNRTEYTRLNLAKKSIFLSI